MKIYFMETVRIMAPLLILVFTGLSCIRRLTGIRAVQENDRKMQLAQLIIKELFLLICFLSEAVSYGSINTAVFGLAVTALTGLADILFARLFRQADTGIMLDAAMLFAAGIVILTRLDRHHALRQFLIAGGCVVFLSALLYCRERIRAVLQKLSASGMGDFAVPAAGLLGLILLAMVFPFGSEVNGSMLGMTLFGITLQPSEPVKPLFVFFLASAFAAGGTKWKRCVLVLAAMGYVFILVLSRDLGSGGIYFVTFVLMAFLATGFRWIPAAGLIAGTAAFAASAFLFSHVRIRVQAFLDPWSVIDSKGYQITQSLFAIAYGGPFGAGLTRGTPKSIPFAETDFVFSAVCEELGIITGICIILLCLLLFLRIFDHAAAGWDRFAGLFLCGTAVLFLTQAFLTIGGETRFIPSTGVTLPLVSYGGSSVVSTLIMLYAVQAVIIGKRERKMERMQAFAERYRQEKEAAAFSWKEEREEM